VVDISNCISNAFCKASQNFVVKRGSRSDTIFDGSSWCRNTSFRNRFAVSLLVIVLCVAINLTIFVKRSINMRIMSFPVADLGNSPELSMPMDSQGRPGIGSGCNHPADA
jgi:hypothetical protein